MRQAKYPRWEITSITHSLCCFSRFYPLSKSYAISKLNIPNGRITESYISKHHYLKKKASVTNLPFQMSSSEGKCNFIMNRITWKGNNRMGTMTKSHY